ncbi:MAG: hypothetical protein EA385_03615 [Salinarimonadaceae bacterium]|nr:MAG: hypothetical protein EA385_03615 [Salinarimonadaceae bacterium]
MTDSTKKRLAIDLEEIERQLRQTAQQAQPSSYATPAAPAQAKNDPLAELARIVGQDDPYRAMLNADHAGIQPRRGDLENDDVFARAAPEEYLSQEYAPDDFAPDEQGAADPYAPQARYPEDYSDEDYARQPYSDDPYREAPEWAAGPYDPDAGHDPHNPQSPDFDAYIAEANAAYPAPHGVADPRLATVAPPRHPDDDLYADDPAYNRYADDNLYPDDDPFADERHMAREPERRGRKRLVLVGALLGVSVISVAAALVFYGDRRAPGEPPLILAEEGPLKVAPQNPGGVEIPDQDRQIFERAGEEETRVVDREEQPVDVAAVSRQSPRVVLPPPAASQQSRADDPIAQALAGAIAPADDFQPSAAVSAAVAELGEPRRVRTVTVRPDGTIVRNETASFMQAPSASGEPATATDSAPTNHVPSAPWRSPALPQVVRDAAPTPAQEPEAPVQIATAPEPVAPQQAPPPPAAPLSLTGSPAPAPAVPQQTASAAAPTSVGGGYAVQLGIRDSQARAEQAFTQFRDRYSNLIGGASPIIMRAEVNGSIIYRVRVGPYALAEANGLCEQIKGAGGDCFVARN